MFTAELEGAEQLAHDWVRVDHAVHAGCRSGVDLGTREGAHDARAGHRFKNRTGKLERSIDGSLTEVRSDEIKGVIIAKARYASFVENGTRPHEIRPKAGAGFVGPLPKGQSRRRGSGAKAVLAWQSGGVWHFARRVMHPGTTALPFMGIAYLKCERVMIREIEVGVARAQRILDG